MSADRTSAKPSSAKSLRPLGAARVIPENAPASHEVVRHPDGWYWISADGHQEIGPFHSKAEALADRDRDDDAMPAEGESLAEAESELGLAGWIDPETGSLADGPSSPHLEDH
jgi:hypothetical protein